MGKNLAETLEKLLGNATEADLESMDAAIAASKARTKSLEAAREIIAEEVLNRATEPDIVKQPKPAPEAIDQAASKVATYLLHAGPKRSDSIKRECKLSDALFDGVVAKDWFEKDGVIWKLSASGRVKFDKKQSA